MHAPTTLLALLLGCAGAAEPASGAPGPGAPAPTAPRGDRAPPEPGEVRVVATGFRNRDGDALIAIYASADGFPNDGDAALAREARPVSAKRAARMAFRGLAPGTYAIAVLHDEDGDREMDTGAFGIPKEGYGASNDARSRFGPPDWEDARFEVRAGERVTQTIRLVYH